MHGDRGLGEDPGSVFGLRAKEKSYTYRARATGTKFQAPCLVFLWPWGETLGRLFLSRPAVPAPALLSGRDKVPVEAALLHEPGVGAPLGDAAVLDD